MTTKEGAAKRAPDGHSPIIRLAPAKLNLTLAVVGRDADGYHRLHSVFAPLGLADRLSLATTTGPSDSLHVSGFDAGPVADNLVLLAISAARSAVASRRPGSSAEPSSLAARLEKAIPVAAGLGGGSSDAAAALDGALEAWSAELEPGQRLELAARIGSDVPFFLAGGPALVEGRGEQVAPLDGLHGHPGVLLVTPAVPLPTREVFAAFDAIRPAGDGAVRMTSTHLAEELRAKLSAADLVARAGAMTMANDLLSAAALVLPALVPFKRSLSRLLHQPVGLAGSGPTLWSLYASEGEAAQAAEALRESLAAGKIEPPGSGPPFIAATTIQTVHHQEVAP